MKFQSEKLEYYLKSLPKRVDFIDLSDYPYTIELEGVTCHFQIQKHDGELRITDAVYRGNEGFMAALVSAYLDMIVGQYLHAVEKLGVKELDYFLRDRPSVACFEFYPDYLYQIVSISQKLRSMIEKWEKSEEIILKKYTQSSFFDLSFSEQLDLIEEVLSLRSHHLLQSKRISLDCEDISDESVFLFSSAVMSEEIQAIIRNDLFKHLAIAFENIHIQCRS